MKPAIMRMVVDFPAPLAPREAETSPGDYRECQVVNGEFVAIAFR
jgi:hypothetical protein